MTAQMQSSISIPAGLTQLAAAFASEGARLYAVGGLVRNSLLGLPVSDIDVCSLLRPDAVLALAKAHGWRCIVKNAAFGTVELHACGLSAEHTTFRSDSYGAGGAHRPEEVAFSDTPEEDAARRDFTVNAMYLDILSGDLLDPTDGRADLAARLIRATSTDPSLIMNDDAVRILRMARFAAELGFAVEPATFAAARAAAEGLYDISAERVRAELDKLLLADVHYGVGSVYAGLCMLDETGALDVLLPELARGRGIEQKPQHHAYDVLSHSLHTAAAAQPTIAARLAALLHDVGKPRMCLTTGRMRGHDREGALIARAIMCRLHYDNDLINAVCLLVREHMYDLNGYAKDSTLREKFATLGLDASLSLCDIREADVHGSGIITGKVATAERWREVIARMRCEGAPFGEAELACDGADIMRWLDISPSPRVGDIKRALLMHCARWPGDNRPDKLEMLVKRM